MKNINKKKLITSFLLCVIGNLIYALSVIIFCEPHGLITGGVTGVSLALHYATGINTSYFTFTFNAIFFILGFFVLGKKFAASTLCSTINYPLWMLVLEFFDFSYFNQNVDTLVAVISSGVLMGIGIGLVMRSGGSTGGIDVVVLILNKYLNFPVGLGVSVIDIFTLAVQLFLPNVTFNLFVYGILMIIIYSIIIDKVLTFGHNKLQIKILSNNNDLISDMILNQMDRGLTYLHSKTGYLKEETDYILTVVEIRELPRIKKLIYEIDPEAFVVISNVKEVKGHGFTSAKVYKNKEN